MGGTGSLRSIRNKNRKNDEDLRHLAFALYTIGCPNLL